MTVALLLAAFVAFLLAALGVPLGRVNLIAVGLALWVLADLVPTVAGWRRP